MFFLLSLSVTYEGCSKSSKPHQERRSIVEHFCYGNKLPLLIKREKRIQISIFISQQVRLIQNWAVNKKSKILMRLRTFGKPSYVMYFSLLLCWSSISQHWRMDQPKQNMLWDQSSKQLFLIINTFNFILVAVNEPDKPSSNAGWGYLHFTLQ